MVVAKRLSRFAIPHWKPVAATFIFVIFQVGFELLKPWPLKFIFDSILTEDSLSGTTLYLLIGITALVVAVSFFDGLLAYWHTKLINLAGRMIVFDLRAALFEHIQRVSLQFHSRRRTGDLMTRVTSDVKAMQDVMTESVVEVVYSAFYLAGMAAVVFWMDWQLAIVGMLAAPVMYYFLVRYTSEVRVLSRQERRREGALATVLHESLGAVRITRVFGREDQARERFREESYASVEAGYQATLAGARFGWALHVLQSIVTASVLGFGVYRVMYGSMTPGELIVFYSYMRTFYRPLRNMMRQFTKATRALARAERVVELLDEEEGVSDRPGAKPAPRFAGHIEFENVTFHYDAGRTVLHDITFAAPAQQVTAVVGPTGAGKTTIASLIPRLYDPAQGAVLIDSVDIREYTLASLRAQVSMVLQESVLFRASIAENIAYGRPDATLERIIETAKAANAHDFITALPDGYETIVGERGETLSGGQRQRIAIARAMIRDAPVLILDEPLVGLDVESQAAVLEALERLISGRTVVLITHQLSTVLRADNVAVIESGRIVQQGPVRELAQADGKFRRLVETERGGILAAPS
jgi:ABC-type multidrug transport system fused ATPase/permease subunit